MRFSLNIKFFVNIIKYYDSFYYKEHLFIVTEILKDNLLEYYKYNLKNEKEKFFKIWIKKFLIIWTYINYVIIICHKNNNKFTYNKNRLLYLVWFFTIQITYKCNFNKKYSICNKLRFCKMKKHNLYLYKSNWINQKYLCYIIYHEHKL